MKVVNKKMHKTKSAFIAVRMQSDLAKLLRQQAGRERLNCSEFIRALLERELIGTTFEDACEALLEKAKKNGKRKKHTKSTCSHSE